MNARSSKKDGFTAERHIASAEMRYARFDETIRSIPKGKVATYGQIAEAAGYLRGHRLVAKFLRDAYMSGVPWQRVVGAGGQIKTSGKGAAKQRSLLKKEGVTFLGNRIDMDKHGFIFEA